MVDGLKQNGLSTSCKNERGLSIMSSLFQILVQSTGRRQSKLLLLLLLLLYLLGGWTTSGNDQILLKGKELFTTYGFTFIRMILS